MPQDQADKTRVHTQVGELRKGLWRLQSKARDGWESHVCLQVEELEEEPMAQRLQSWTGFTVN